MCTNALNFLNLQCTELSRLLQSTVSNKLSLCLSKKIWTKISFFISFCNFGYVCTPRQALRTEECPRGVWKVQLPASPLDNEEMSA